MNPVLAYAIEHQAEARGIIVGKGFRGDDVDDIAQMVLLKICAGDPQGIEYVRAYWYRCILNMIGQHLRNVKRALKLEGIRLDRDAPDRQITPRDPREEPERIVCQREELREAWEIATKAQRRAMIDRLSQNGRGSVNTRVNICRLKRRIRERAAI